MKTERATVKEISNPPIKGLKCMKKTMSYKLFYTVLK